VYSKDEFNLKVFRGRFRFFNWLYKCPSALSFDVEIPDIKDRLKELKRKVINKGFGGFTYRPSKRPNTGKNPSPSGAPSGDARDDAPGDGHTHRLNNLSTYQMLSKAGYQLLSEVEVEGWTPLNPVRLSSIQVNTPH